MRDDDSGVPVVQPQLVVVRRDDQRPADVPVSVTPVAVDLLAEPLLDLAAPAGNAVRAFPVGADQPVLVERDQCPLGIPVVRGRGQIDAGRHDVGAQPVQG